MANPRKTQRMDAWWANPNHLSAEEREYFSKLLPKRWQEEKKTQYLDAVGEIFSAPNAMVKPMTVTRAAAIKLSADARRLAGALAALDGTDLFRLQPFYRTLWPKSLAHVPH